MRIKLDNVLGIFNKALVKLEQFTEQCDSDIRVHENVIERAEEQKRIVSVERERAVKSLEKIKEIVG